MEREGGRENIGFKPIYQFSIVVTEALRKRETNQIQNKQKEEDPVSRNQHTLRKNHQNENK